MAEWIQYIGSNEQIAELKESKHGFLLKSSDRMYENEIIYADADFSCIDAFNVTNYLICEPHPLRNMIKQQADTGQPVYQRGVCMYADKRYTLLDSNTWLYETTAPDWNIEGAEYSLTLFEEWLLIDENTPKDIDIIVYAPAYQGLPAMASMCRWHESAGFCIDELRTPTHYKELI